MTVRRGLWLTATILLGSMLSCSGVERQSSSVGVAPVWTSQVDKLAQDLTTWRGQGVVLRTEAGAGTLMTLHDPATGRITDRFGTQGLGPSDVLAPFALTVDSVTGQLWVLDLTRRRWTGFDDVTGKGFVPVQAIQFADPNTILHAVWWHRLIVSSGFYSEGQFAVFDSAGSLMRYAGTPLQVSPLEDLEVAYHLNRARLGVTSDSVVFLARFLRPQLEFYNLSGRRVYVAGAEISSDSQVIGVEDATGRIHAIPTDRTQFAYLALPIGSSRVFTLYSGRSEHSEGPAAVHGNLIRVFSSRGVLEQSASLSVDLDAIQVDESHGMLYGVGQSTDGDDQHGILYAFRLSEILRRSVRDTPPTRISVVPAQ